jgi:hypothetical protein
LLYVLFKTELVSRPTKCQINHIHNGKAYRRIKLICDHVLKTEKKKLEGVSVTMKLKSLCGIIAG